MKRPLASSSALLWGLQFAFLNPVLALLLVTLFHATTADVGQVLAGLASIKALGYPGLFAASAVLTIAALSIIEATRRAPGRLNAPAPEITAPAAEISARRPAKRPMSMTEGLIAPDRERRPPKSVSAEIAVPGRPVRAARHRIAPR